MTKFHFSPIKNVNKVVGAWQQLSGKFQDEMKTNGGPDLQASE